MRPALVAMALVMFHAAAARAQGVGFTGGVGLDPSQVYAGTFIESPPLGVELTSYRRGPPKGR